MHQLGGLLRRARQDRQISLEALSEQTKIRRRYLESMEKGEFDKLPAQVYLKGFLRGYALAVGLDPEEVLDTYAELSASSTTKAPLSVRQRRAARLRKQRWTAGVIAAAALVSYLGYLLFR